MYTYTVESPLRTMQQLMKCSRCKEITSASKSNKSYCRPCYNDWRREYRKQNPHIVKGQIQRALAKAPERFKEYDRKSYWQNRDKRIAKSRRWNVANKEAFAAREAARRAAQKAATPTWADWDAIEAVYLAAAQRTQETGALHHVDHIVPLKSALVCGLHVPANLQVLPAFDNQSKSNRRWPDMP
jgi:hypothetical protein